MELNILKCFLEAYHGKLIKQRVTSGLVQEDADFTTVKICCPTSSKLLLIIELVVVVVVVVTLAAVHFKSSKNH